MATNGVITIIPNTRPNYCQNHCLSVKIARIAKIAMIASSASSAFVALVRRIVDIVSIYAVLKVGATTQEKSVGAVNTPFKKFDKVKIIIDLIY